MKNKLVAIYRIIVMLNCYSKKAVAEVRIIKYEGEKRKNTILLTHQYHPKDGKEQMTYKKVLKPNDINRIFSFGNNFVTSIEKRAYCTEENIEKIKKDCIYAVKRELESYYEILEKMKQEFKKINT